MGVGEQDAIEPTEAEPALEQLTLGALTTVHQEPAVPVQHHQRWQPSVDGRHTCGSAKENDFEQIPSLQNRHAYSDYDCGSPDAKARRLEHLGSRGSLRATCGKALVRAHWHGITGSRAPSGRAVTMLAGIRRPHGLDRGRCDAEVGQSQCVGAYHVILLHQFDMVPGYGSTRQGPIKAASPFQAKHGIGISNRLRSMRASTSCTSSL